MTPLHPTTHSHNHHHLLRQVQRYRDRDAGPTRRTTGRALLWLSASESNH